MPTLPVALIPDALMSPDAVMLPAPVPSTFMLPSTCSFSVGSSGPIATYPTALEFVSPIIFNLDTGVAAPV